MPAHRSGKKGRKYGRSGRRASHKLYLSTNRSRTNKLRRIRKNNGPEAAAQWERAHP